MELDIERLRSAVEWAEAEAKKADGKWNQGTWAQGEVGEELPDNGEYLAVNCGTAFCIAGSVCAAAGDTFVTVNWGYLKPGDEVDVTYVSAKGRGIVTVDQRALELLGLEDSLVEVETTPWGPGFDDLFDGTNTIEDVRRIATAIAKQHGHEL